MVLKFLQEEKWLKCIIEDILRHQSVSISRLPLPLCLPGMFPLQISHFSLPWWLSGKESTRSEETWIQSLGWKDPLEKEMETHSSILAWEVP